MKTASLAVVVVAPSQPLIIGGISIVGTNLVVTGTNGTVAVNYYVLATTNLAVPVTNWKVLYTNQFGPGRSVNFANPLNPNSPQVFYLLKLP